MVRWLLYTKLIFKPMVTHFSDAYMQQLVNQSSFKVLSLVTLELRYSIISCNIIFTSMMTSSNGDISALLAICAGNSPVPDEFPTQRPVTRSFDVFFDLRLNKRLSKQWWGWWFETLSRPLWRHRNVDNCNAIRPRLRTIVSVYQTIH